MPISQCANNNGPTMYVKFIIMPWPNTGPNYYSVRGHPFMTSTRRGRGSGSGGRMWTEGGGPAPCGRPHRKLKLESTDVILSSSHAKKLASFLPEFRLWTEKSGNFSAI